MTEQKGVRHPHTYWEKVHKVDSLYPRETMAETLPAKNKGPTSHPRTSAPLFFPLSLSQALKLLLGWSRSRLVVPLWIIVDSTLISCLSWRALPPSIESSNSLSEILPQPILCHASSFSESVPSVSQSRFAIKGEGPTLETLKEEKEGVDGKLAGLLKASKDFDNLIESQRRIKFQAQQKKKMMKKSSSSENEPCYSKDCKKNIDSLNNNIKGLKIELSDSNTYRYSCKLGVDQLKGRLVEYKEREVKYIEKIRTLEMYRASNLDSIKILTKVVETLKEKKDVVDGKLACLLKSSKDLENIIESQRSDKAKDGLGYNAVLRPAADLYLSPKKDLSWTGLLEFADDTVTEYIRPSPTVESTSAEGQNKNSTTAENGESTDSILSKPAVKFVKAAERPTTDKVETVKKPTVRYAEMYKRTSKRSNVRGNQIN
nr:hypothetical protein [Tanacetum cinerariifolium]